MAQIDKNSLYLNTDNYANMFEWNDGNPNKENRSAYFVTLYGGKIIKATSADDYILGVTFDNLAETEESYKWNMVAILGQVNVKDDGSCAANMFCQPNNNGIATRSDSGFRVLDRIAADTVTILIK